MKIKLVYISILAVGILFSSCKKSDTAPLTGKTFVVNATSESKWVYFSFDKNDTVSISSPSTSLSWDIAIRRFNIETNSGVSGKGKGGASNSGKMAQTGFDQLTLVSDTATFMVDDSITVAGAQGALETVAANPLLSNWYDYNFATNVLSSKNIIYIVKTASGKYAKVWVVSYYSNSNVSGYVTINYIYQPDGSKNF